MTDNDVDEEGGSPIPLDPGAFDAHRDRLRRLVAFRLDQRLQGRIDPSDVVQETYLDAVSRWDEYARSPAVTPFVWLRFLACQRVATAHRHHLGRDKRDPQREVSMFAGFSGSDTSQALAIGLLSPATDPGDAALRAERHARLLEALHSMADLDREVLALRHFEGLSNAETAEALSITTSAASKRYIRALEKLKQLLADLGDWSGGGNP